MAGKEVDAEFGGQISIRVDNSALIKCLRESKSKKQYEYRLGINLGQLTLIGWIG